MKVYIFTIHFKHHSPINDVISSFNINDGDVYAFTTNKDLRNEFISTRNMEYFKEVKADISESKYDEFFKFNRDLELKYVKVNTKKQHKGKYRVQSFDVLTNEMEFDTIDTYSYTHIFNEINDNVDYNTVNMVNNNVLKHTITFILYKYFYFREIGENFLNDDDAIEYNDKLIIDTLGVYLLVYKKLYKS